MAKKRLGKKSAKKGGKGSPKPPLSLGGSPITIGGGSISIEFNETDFPAKPGGDHVEASKKVLKTVKITNGSQPELDLSAYVSGDLDLCSLEILHSSPDGVIIIKAKPLGIRFDPAAFRQGTNPDPSKPDAYYSATAKIKRVDFYCQDGADVFTFNFPAGGQGNVFVKSA